MKMLQYDTQQFTSFALDGVHFFCLEVGSKIILTLEIIPEKLYTMSFYKINICGATIFSLNTVNK